MGSRVVAVMDGSTRVSTAALLDHVPGAGWRVLARRADADGRGQARVLLGLIDGMLEETGRRVADVGAVVAGIGPGTFTGVRIAVATARAAALALDVPVLGVSTLAALVAEAVRSATVRAGTLPESIVPVVDARREQVFYGLYRQTAIGPESSVAGPVYQRVDPFAVCDRSSLLSSLPTEGETLVVGDVGIVAPEGAVASDAADAAICLHSLEVGAEYLVIGQEALSEPEDGPSGLHLGPWLQRALDVPGRIEAQNVGEPGTPEAVKPIYVRSPDADIHITKMRDPWSDAAGQGRA